MSYMPTDQDVLELKEYMVKPKFLTEALNIGFTTEEAFVREVLPPCLEPTAEPSGTVEVSRWQTRGIGTFTAALVYVNATYEGVDGVFPIASYFGNQNNTSWNREVWGEGGKTADSSLHADGNRRWGYGSRHGVTFLEIEAEVGEDLGATQSTGRYYEVKAFISNEDGGLQYDPILYGLDETDSVTTHREGTGSFVLRSTPFDPLGEIPILSQGEVSYSESYTDYTLAKVVSFPDRDNYLRYAYGTRYWDDPRLLAAPPRFK